MKRSSQAVGWLSLVAFCLASAVSAEETKPAGKTGPIPPVAIPGSGTPPVISGPVTITGVVVIREAQAGKEDVILTALDGPAEIKAEFAKIIKAWPAAGLDGIAGRNIENQFINKLTYKIDGPDRAKMIKTGCGMWNGALASVTGTISSKNNQVWFTCESHKDGKFTYPDVMMMSKPDVALHTSTVPPLVLKAGSESVKCLHIDAGCFLMGQPWYMAYCTPWDPPHMVTFTKGFYEAEVPITNELYNAVMPASIAVPAGTPAQSAANLSLADARKFCEAFSKLSGRKVHLPTRAQLSHVMRCGTSNPPFNEKYTKNGGGVGKPAAVKSSKPNAWGFYEWIGTYNYWEGTNDKKFIDSKDVVDPDYPGGDKDAWTMVGGWAIGEIEYGNGAVGNGKNIWARYRIVVDE